MPSNLLRAWAILSKASSERHEKDNVFFLREHCFCLT